MRRLSALSSLSFAAVTLVIGLPAAQDSSGNRATRKGAPDTDVIAYINELRAKAYLLKRPTTPPSSQSQPEAESGPAASSLPPIIALGFDSMEPKRLIHILPTYPDAARSDNLTGAIKVVLTVGTDGKVTDLPFVIGEKVLGEAAARAVSEWGFEPTLVEGLAVRVITAVEFEFSSDGTVHENPINLPKKRM